MLRPFVLRHAATRDGTLFLTTSEQYQIYAYGSRDWSLRVGWQRDGWRDPWGGPEDDGADKNYETQDCVQQLRDRNITPHVAQNNSNRRSAIDGRTTRHPGYETSQKKRKLVEQMFGWAKTVGLVRKTRHRGADRVNVSTRPAMSLEAALSGVTERLQAVRYSCRLGAQMD